MSPLSTLLASYLATGFIYSVRGMLRVVPRHAHLGSPWVVATAGVIGVLFATIAWPWVVYKDFKGNV